MSILVTGGAGYIGSHTVHQLVESGFKVVVLDDLSTGYLSSLPEQVHFVKGSTKDFNLVSRIIRDHHIKSVIHFAASIVVPESVVNPLKYYENNAVSSFYLIKACIEAGVLRFVFSSTAAVYGALKNLPIAEDALISPLNPYGHSKRMTEVLLEDLSNSFDSTLHFSERFRFIALRYFNVAGAQIAGKIGQNSKNATHLIKVACEAACGRRDSVEIYGTDYDTYDGTCIRDYIHVDDLARAHLDALKYLDQGGESNVFNCGYGHGFSVREVISMVKKVSGYDFRVREGGRRLGDSPSIIADNSKIRKLLHWQPKLDDLELICRSAYQWEFKQRKS
jgi:UDP-glucose 4-epimerase